MVKKIIKYCCIVYIGSSLASLSGMGERLTQAEIDREKTALKEAYRILFDYAYEGSDDDDLIKELAILKKQPKFFKPKNKKIKLLKKIKNKR